jgi:2-desacetyl-2-hydroxyethyl bacteriochlorophyllide A dehydrogenase
MKALYFDGKLALRDLPEPRLKPGEALVRVRLAGICGTDREILKGYSAFHGVPGHEFVGEVVECENASWRGKRVVGEINIACGECNLCLWGLGKHCPRRTVIGIVNRNGAFAEFLTVPVENLHEVPASIEDEAAVFVEPLAAASEFLPEVRLTPAVKTAVLGDGRLGLLVSQVLRHTRANVTLFGRHDCKLKLAESWGVRTVPAGHALEERSFGLVIEATGSPAGISDALRLVEPRGTVVMKSTYREPASFDTAKLVVDEIRLIGSRCGSFSVALGLLAEGAIKVRELVSKTFPLEQGLEAFRYLERPSCLKVLLAPSTGKAG